MLPAAEDFIREVRDIYSRLDTPEGFLRTLRFASYVLAAERIGFRDLDVPGVCGKDHHNFAL